MGIQEGLTDQKFPLIDYAPGASPRERGQYHGERFRSGISELCAIRRGLMLGRNPKLAPSLNELAEAQWQKTKSFDAQTWEELDGIREGSGLTVGDLVILNNYTDFRDISVDEGCSTVYGATKEARFCGQTWDMHSSASKYVCVIHVPQSETTPEVYLFSLVGCVGMMGFNQYSCSVAINNLNTEDARLGILWPALVRKCLVQRSVAQMSAILQSAPVTSAHAYLLGDRDGAEVWEVSPTRQKKVGSVSDSGMLFHTNHCLDPELQQIEQKQYLSQTTKERYRLLEAKIALLTSRGDLNELLQDHEGFPKSICSHFQSGAQDPSFTCGGATIDYGDLKMNFWRGCDKVPDLRSEIEVSFGTD